MEQKSVFIVVRSRFPENISISEHTPFWSTTLDNIKVFQNLWERKGENTSVYILFTLSGTNTFCGVAKMNSDAIHDPLPQWVQQTRKYSNAFELDWIYKGIQVRIPDDTCTSDATILSALKGDLILQLFANQRNRMLYQFSKRKLSTSNSPIKKRKICV